MGRHHQQGHVAPGAGTRWAPAALGVVTLVGLASAGGYALAGVPTPVAPVAAPTVVAPAVPTTAAPAPPTVRHAPVPAKHTAATPKRTTTKRAAPVCDLSGPPVFGDPSNPDRITNRNCGYTDDQGRSRSRDRWIDDQLLDAAR